MHELAINILSANIRRLREEAQGFAGLAAADSRVARIHEDIDALKVSLGALQEAQP
jgi:hypothetical protein